MEIPEGWQSANLGKLVRLRRGHDLPAQNRIAGNVKVIGGGGPNGSHNVAKAPAPGIVIGRSGSGIGNAWWSNEPYWPLNTGLYVTDFLKNDPQFCFLWLDQMDFRSHNSGGAQPSLNRNFIYPIPLSLPPLPEQKKIAEILSTWDRAIEVSEKLLENATSQKRALMQQLLTGKRRFPEFEGQEWRKVKLHEIAEIIVSNVDKKSVDNEIAVRLCNYTDVYKSDQITTDMLFMEATANATQIKRFGLKVGDVIITKDSETPSDIAVPSYVKETADNLVCGYHLAIIRPKNMESMGRFLKHLFELPHSQYYFGTRANGATRFGLTISSIEDAEFMVPQLAEQIKISNLIAMSERAISRHRLEIEYLVSQKKALMQQLLTGKIRVKV